MARRPIITRIETFEFTVELRGIAVGANLPGVLAQEDNVIRPKRCAIRLDIDLGVSIRPSVRFSSRRLAQPVPLSLMMARPVAARPLVAQNGLWPLALDQMCGAGFEGSDDFHPRPQAQLVRR